MTCVSERTSTTIKSSVCVCVCVCVLKALLPQALMTTMGCGLQRLPLDTTHGCTPRVCVCVCVGVWVCARVCGGGWVRLQYIPQPNSRARPKPQIRGSAVARHQAKSCPRVLREGLPGGQPPPPPPCDTPSGCCSFTGPWTVTRSSLRMLHRVAAFCRPLQPVLLLVLFPRLRSPVVGVPGLCWLRWDVPFARQRRPVVGILRLCWLLRGLFDCFC